jgi:hypothetical protein
MDTGTCTWRIKGVATQAASIVCAGVGVNPDLSKGASPLVIIGLCRDMEGFVNGNTAQ